MTCSTIGRSPMFAVPVTEEVFTISFSSGLRTEKVFPQAAARKSGSFLFCSSPGKRRFVAGASEISRRTAFRRFSPFLLYFIALSE